MTRPKIDPEKRQRTAQACDSCKRRKQKCDGQKPCATCTKRQFDCEYETSDHDNHYDLSSSQPSPKRPKVDRNVPECHTSVTNDDTPPMSRFKPENAFAMDPHQKSTGNALADNLVEHTSYFPSKPEASRPQIKVQPDRSSSNGEEEEAENHTMTRMLMDGNGRLLYVGDAANISFLQLLRMIVETTAGSSPFTLDPERHRIVEAKMSLSHDLNLTHSLPEKATVLILVDSFFTNTHGVMEIFSEREYLESLDRCYADPLTMDVTWLCLFNLVLAIGLSFATPRKGSHEAKVVESLRARYPHQSEVFYLNAQSLRNPLVVFEDADFWSVQALCLMGLYMLTISKRNTAYAYIGMAVRSAYALGLHREETLVIFSAEDQAARRKLWRSLFILDRFLAASLGRPEAIHEGECSGDILDPTEHGSIHPARPHISHLCGAGLEAAVRSCHVVGIILKKVYQQRKISTRLAQELADECKKWPETLDPSLHWRQASPNNVRQAIAILHSNIIYCHSIVLLTRPFFLYLLSAEIQRTRLNSTNHPPIPSRGRLEKFSDACMIASTHTIALVQNAYEGGYLPRLNPFSTYSLFSAALVIFANEFARPSSKPLITQCMANAITIMRYCGEMDPQANRAVHILTEFHNVITSQNSAQQCHPQPAPSVQPPTYPNKIDNNSLATEPGPQQPFTQTPPYDDPAKLNLPPLPGATASLAPASLPAFTTLPPSDSAPTNGQSATLAPPSMPHEESFSGLLDLNVTALPSGDDPYLSGSSADEAIDFDALWQWPGETVLFDQG